MTRGRAKPKVVIVDDHLTVSAGLQLLLNANGFNVVACVDSTKAAMSVVKSQKPDLVLLDSVIPKDDPVAMVDKMIKASSATSVVLSAQSVSDSMLDRVVRVQASGIVLKSEKPERLILALEQVLEGESYFSPEIEGRLVKTRGIEPRSRLSALSPREMEVLQLLSEDYSVKEVAAELNIKPTTVETHRQSLRAKLDIRGSAGMAKFAIREGLIEV